ncbi:MAG: dTDP-4-dehydrorhamnose 3,5-epimerase [Candidatus Kapabacteria bacterium]|nr:dTDP-4-dehydrorhamnose 3,5-epimerase [Candidatus Kapabacteria bacterium]MDW8011465.1 dTDP-4-dehydrorhamnose 3,5-epimerase [Bacteroidota bacterium]
MPWELVQTAFHDGAVKLFRSRQFRDERGWFLEVFRVDEAARWGIREIVQENHSRSRRGVIRGLHFQHTPPMGKLLRVTRGRAFVVEVDVRKQSPSCGRWWSVELTARDPLLLWIPPGFANGFCALSPVVEVQYLCTALYNPAGEVVIRWDDPELGIPWPVTVPILSERDRLRGMSLREWLQHPAAESFGT